MWPIAVSLMPLIADESLLVQRSILQTSKNAPVSLLRTSSVNCAVTSRLRSSVIVVTSAFALSAEDDFVGRLDDLRI
jgi:hypothetical protein